MLELPVGKQWSEWVGELGEEAKIAHKEALVAHLKAVAGKTEKYSEDDWRKIASSLRALGQAHQRSFSGEVPCA